MPIPSETFHMVTHPCSWCHGLAQRTNGHKDSQNNLIYKPCTKCNATGVVMVKDLFQALQDKSEHAGLLRMEPRISGAELSWLINEVTARRTEVEFLLTQIVKSE